MNHKKITRVRKTRFYKRMFQASGIIIAFFMVVGIFTKDKTYSETENRELAGPPKLEAFQNASYFNDMNAWITDQFAFRNQLMSLRTTGQKMMGRKECNGVYFGRNGYLLEKPVSPDIKAEEKTENAINLFTEKHSDINSVMMIVPDCATTFPELLLKGTPVRKQSDDVNNFEEKISEKVVKVDVKTILSSDKSSQIYYRTDHHWTSKGAYDLFVGAAENLGIKNTGEYDIYKVSNSFSGTMASKSGVYSEADSIDIYSQKDNDVKYYVEYPDLNKKVTSVYDSGKLKDKDQYSVFFGGNHPIVTIKTTADSGRNLLVFKDSYANSFVPFLVPYFDNIIMIDPRYYYENPESEMKIYNITDVLYLYSADTFLTDTSLAEVLNDKSTSSSGNSGQDVNNASSGDAYKISSPTASDASTANDAPADGE